MTGLFASTDLQGPHMSPGRLVQYPIQTIDVQGPFAPQIPEHFEQKGRLQRYRSPREFLTEKFDMSEAPLAADNPNAKSDQPGTVITVATPFAFLG